MLLLDAIRDTRELSDATKDGLEAAIAEFKRSFATGSGAPLVGKESFEAMGEGFEGQEAITRHKPASAEH